MTELVGVDDRVDRVDHTVGDVERNPSRQLAYRGSQPRSFLALSFEDPRALVIWATTNSPASGRPSQAGTRSGGFAPRTSAR